MCCDMGSVRLCFLDPSRRGQLRSRAMNNKRHPNGEYDAKDGDDGEDEDASDDDVRICEDMWKYGTLCEYVMICEDVPLVPCVPIVFVVPLVAFVVSSPSSVASVIQVFDSAEFLVRAAVERLGLDTAESLHGWRRRSRFHSTFALLTYNCRQIKVEDACFGSHKARSLQITRSTW